jgi:hypothetical protein
MPPVSIATKISSKEIIAVNGTSRVYKFLFLKSLRLGLAKIVQRTRKQRSFKIEKYGLIWGSFMFLFEEKYRILPKKQIMLIKKQKIIF